MDRSRPRRIFPHRSGRRRPGHPYGHFLNLLDGAGRAVIRHRRSSRATGATHPRRTRRSRRTAKELSVRILEERRGGHRDDARPRGYLGREFQRAETCLGKGRRTSRIETPPTNADERRRGSTKRARSSSARGSSDWKRRAVCVLRLAFASPLLVPRVPRSLRRLQEIIGTPLRALLLPSSRRRIELQELRGHVVAHLMIAAWFHR